MVLAHDGYQPARAAAIARRFGARTWARTYAGGGGGAEAGAAAAVAAAAAPLVDLLLLVRATFLIGHPASTFTGSAARVRTALRPADPQMTVRCSRDAGLAYPSVC